MRAKEALAGWLEIEPSATIPCVVVSAAALVVSLGGWGRGVLPFDVALVAAVLCGGPIVVGAVRGLVTEHDVTADVLVSLALVASLYAHEWFAAGEVALIMQVGSMLEDHTAERARRGIEALVRLTPQRARVRRGGGFVEVDAGQVQAGDEVRVLAGETVPVDGVVTEGTTAVDQSVMTGESMPVDKAPGDEVASGVVNQLGTFTMRALRPCVDSSLARMVRLAEEADASKAPVVGLADRWAAALVGVALVCALLAWGASGQFVRAVTVLVVFCPCAFVLATPTAVSAGIANATRWGALVRSGAALERLAQVDHVATDKTGTLTLGRPRVVATEPLAPGFSADGVLALAARLEERSEHPLGRAVAASWQARVRRAGAFGEGDEGPSAAPSDGAPSGEPTDFEVLPGRGVAARVGGREVIVGTPSLLEARSVDPAVSGPFVREWSSRGAATMLLAVGGTCVGALALSDELRPEAAASVAGLASLGVGVTLLTGDSEAAASDIASRAHITDVRAGLLPEEKLAGIRALGRHVCMVGDGVNDALALKSAFVGVAMGGIGSDVAVEAADVVLVRDDLSRVPYLIGLSRAVMRKVRQNIVFGLGINLVAVALSVTGVLTPVTAALFHNCGSVFVVLNAAALLRRRAD